MSPVELAVAFTAGLLSFASPCVLPLVPVYLSVTTGLGVADLSRPGARTAATVVRGAGLFSLGFSAVFVALGLSATAVGGLLLRHQAPITRLAGVVVVALAVLMLLADGRGPLAREWRLRLPAGLADRAWAPPVAGAAFAFGWTPCIGPVLGSVLAVAAAGGGGAVRGGVLLTGYSAGLAVPLLLTGLAFQRALVPLRWSRRHGLGLRRGTALLLGGYGVLLVLDRLSWLTATLQSRLGGPT